MKIKKGLIELVFNILIVGVAMAGYYFIGFEPVAIILLAMIYFKMSQKKG